VKAAVHCADCAKRFSEHNPLGRIYLHIGESPYHLAIEEWGAGPTVCGLDSGEFTNIIGTIGLELSDDDMRHPWLQMLEPCPACWDQVW
jgi:hypothetical protein